MNSKFKSLAEAYKLKNRYPKVKIFAPVLRNIPKPLFSQASQDSIVLTEFFQQISAARFPKVFLDVGCNQPILYSNSYFFERHLGFQTYAVDPLPTYENQWKLLRPSAIFSRVALGSVSTTELMTIFESEPSDNPTEHPADMFSTLTHNHTKSSAAKSTTIPIQVEKTQDFLTRNCITEIGIMSIDVEGYEQSVLDGIDFKRTAIHVAIIENNTPNRHGSEHIRHFMADKGFRLYARIWGSDDIFINNNRDS